MDLVESNEANYGHKPRGGACRQCLLNRDAKGFDCRRDRKGNILKGGIGCGYFEAVVEN